MNAIPAFSKAVVILLMVASRPPNRPSEASKRFIVGIETPAVTANSSCDHPSKLRAAFICLIDTFSIDKVKLHIDT
jgi:hypothetical protein